MKQYNQAIHSRVSTAGTSNNLRKSIIDQAYRLLQNEIDLTKGIRVVEHDQEIHKEPLSEVVVVRKSWIGQRYPRSHTLLKLISKGG